MKKKLEPVELTLLRFRDAFGSNNFTDRHGYRDAAERAIEYVRVVQKQVDDFDRRVVELILSNNENVERRRKAERSLEVAQEQIKQLEATCAKLACLLYND